MSQKGPDIQLISNLVITAPDGQVLFVRYQPDDERWWLPGEDLEPFEHPDERAGQVVAGFRHLHPDEPRMMFVESFRGRRGWHIVFHYLVHAGGEPGGDLGGEYETAWFPPDRLPRTVHGPWERNVVGRVLAEQPAP